LPTTVPPLVTEHTFTSPEARLRRCALSVPSRLRRARSSGCSSRWAASMGRGPCGERSAFDGW